MNERTSQLLIVVGDGGVGKTTVASLMALRLALLGKKTIVITLDPARRLADILSLKERGAMPERVDLASFINGTEQKTGELWALMPDLAQEWQDFLAASIHRADLRHDISQNPFFRYMAEGLPKSFEIIMAHLLVRLMNSGEYDAIVLDTPPSSHSVAFFDLPSQLERLLEHGIFRKLVNKRHSLWFKVSKRLALLSSGLLEKTLERIIGSHFLSELLDFAFAIDELYEPMLKRAQGMDRLLKASGTRFLLVLRPTPKSIEDGVALFKALKKRDLFLDKLVFNQVLPDPFKNIGPKELLKLDEDYKDGSAIKNIVNLYRAECDMQKQLLAQSFGDFLDIKKHILYAHEPDLAQADLLAKLLADYEQVVKS